MPAPETKIVDSYRVFRMYEHWVNEGAVKLREAATDAS